MLPEFSSLDLPMLRWLRSEVSPQRVRELTQGRDTLFAPLEPTRECFYSDDPVCAAVRAEFCESPFHVRYVRDLLIVSDYLGDDANAVMGAGETTAVLYIAAEREERQKRVLDLGCGAGTLGLLLARHADAVVATDINPRAVEMARINAALNEIPNVDFRCGDLFEPVRGERFDLIVSQPPYYPGSGQWYLHGGQRGHEVAERMLLNISDHLTDTGRAIVHAAWPLDWSPSPAAGWEVTEYTPGVGEMAGTRHSLLVIERGEGVRRIDVPPERWGSLAGI